MALMRAQHRQGSRHKDGLRIGLRVSTLVENDGLFEYFFGKDGKTCLAHGKFVQFLKDLHNEVSDSSFNLVVYNVEVENELFPLVIVCQITQHYERHSTCFSKQ